MKSMCWVILAANQQQARAVTQRPSTQMSNGAEEPIHYLTQREVQVVGNMRGAAEAIVKLVLSLLRTLLLCHELQRPALETSAAHAPTEAFLPVLLAAFSGGASAAGAKSAHSATQ
ncbi:hypothetical protein CYMTET_31116, partial [Cymbomonas tetramitiformis]